MNPMLLGGVLEIGRTIIGRLIPDPEKKAAAEMEMVKMAAEGELKQYAIRNKNTGEIICFWACDDPPPGYWGLHERPEDFVAPVIYDGGLTADQEEIVLFDADSDFVLELGEKAQKDKKYPYQILDECFEYDTEKKCFKERKIII